jgi:hypothetical protein
MKNKLLALCALVTLSVSVFAQVNNPVITAVPSLNIAPDARAGGMGDVGVATSPDVNSQYWNAAKYVFMESDAGVSVSYTPWLRQLVPDINLSYLAGYWKLDQRQALSASLRYFTMGAIALMDEQGTTQGTANPNEYSIDVAYSRLLSEKLSASATLRFIHSDLNNGINFANGGSSVTMYPGSAVAADVAAYYRTHVALQDGDGKLAFGLSISNIGSKISYDKNETSNFIPTNLRLGGSFEYPIDNFNKISVSLDLNKLLVPTQDSLTSQQYSDMSPITGIFKSFSAPGGFKEEMQEIMWSVGAEYAYNNQFFVRGGYYNENKYKGNRKYFTAGAGFKLNIFQLDASYIMAVAQSNPLDQTLRFSLSFDLYGLKNLIK